MAVEAERLQRFFSTGRQHFATSPLYGVFAETVLNDPDLLAIAAECREGQQPSNLLFAAVHFLLLKDAEVDAGAPLAAYYPDLAGAAALPAEQAGPAFREFCLARRDELVPVLQTRLVQTNVVKRSMALRFGLSVVAGEQPGPVTLLEIGPSSGIHLRFDRYRYELAGRRFGDPSSPVLIDAEWRSQAQPPNLDRLPAIANRFGLDLNPIDPRDAEERRWLQALVWPENGHEGLLLGRALAVVAEDPPRIIAGNALDLLPRLDAELPAGQPLVVFHAAVLAHVPEQDRPRFNAAISALGARRPLYRLALEGGRIPDPRYGPGLAAFVLELETVAGDRNEFRRLALVEGHGEWLLPLETA